MPTLTRVPTAKFKYNMRPYIQKAKAGEQVIVTCSGRDEFQIVPVTQATPEPLPEGSVAWHSADADEPAFESWDKNNESLA